MAGKDPILAQIGPRQDERRRANSNEERFWQSKLREALPAGQRTFGLSAFRVEEVREIISQTRS